MMCNNQNLYRVKSNAYIKFCVILSICSQDIERKCFCVHKSEVITLDTNGQKSMCNNPIVDRVNINAYIKFGEILSFCSQKYERKGNIGINQGP